MEKFKGLTTVEKIGYIRDYYTLHIIAGILAIAAVGWALNHYVFNPPPQTFINVSFFGQFVSEDFRNVFAEDLTVNLIDPSANQRAMVDNFFSTGNNPEFDMAMTQRMVAMVAATEIDVFIIAPDEIDGLIGGGFGSDLRVVLHPDAFGQLYEIGAIYFNEILIPLGIKVEHLPYFQNLTADFDLDFSGWALVVLPNSVRDLAVNSFLDHILFFTPQHD